MKKYIFEKTEYNIEKSNLEATVEAKNKSEAIERFNQLKASNQIEWSYNNNDPEYDFIYNEEIVLSKREKEEADFISVVKLKKPLSVNDTFYFPVNSFEENIYEILRKVFLEELKNDNICFTSLERFHGIINATFDQNGKIEFTLFDNTLRDFEKINISALIDMLKRLK